ncbi:hypothetical protein IMC75_02040 [Campylobacter peloridis]|uniref:Tetratricopeptide repeat protein n=1 Tax=Campylobacter peloridis TaxID=488546 RepID=A0ABX6TTC4_9BACT|nr:hypothetical protein [Campylobacter peloridis]AJC85258.1 tetratricopeptide repeat protein [Campylobacter peloridis LMG 23910]QOQ89275.1 hypothetical protein IMC75_02040 [Campylobacter peloridis]
MLDQILYAYVNEDYEKCLAYSQAYLQDDPKSALEYASLASFKMQDYDKTIFYTEQIFKQSPTTFFGLILAKSYLAKSRFDEALKLLNILLERKDLLNNEIMFELAFVYKSLGDFYKAEEMFLALLKEQEYNLNLWKHYAELYFKSDYAKSLKLHDQIYTIAQEMIAKLQNQKNSNNNQNSSLNLEDRLYAKTKENADIEKIKNFIYKQILPQKAYLLFKLYDLENSLKLYDFLQEYNQDNAAFWQNYAKALEFSTNYQEAYEAYSKALKLHSHATYAFDLAYLLMRVGNFEEGVRMYESRLFYANSQTFSAHHYNQSLQAFNKLGIKAFEDKNILVFCEQGFGDTIMYSRCLQKLSQIAKKVLFAPQSAMYRLFKNSLKDTQILQNFKNMKVLKDFPAEFDFAIPICSLPLFCSISMDELSTLKTPIKALEKINNKKKKIGIFWFTPSAYDSDIARNLDLDFLLNSLKDLPFELVSFQIQGDFNLPKNIENRAKLIKDWEDTFNHLADIDCVISIDSAIAHLSLALKIPTIVLLAPRFDWRWGKFESPKSAFWPDANLLVFGAYEQTKKQLQELVKNILK